ncbi:GFA family protein [Rhodobacteraceae bacterium NNCM2]|nr:GFA family protein [Coraliihabitans acroporae]
MTEQTGRCLCGEVTFAFSGPANWQGHCHCESCRRATSSPLTSFIGVPNGSWRWTGTEPACFESSPGVRRRFCARCGSQMSFEADRFPDEIHFYAATLDAPEGFAPQFHVFAAEALDWFEVRDTLPRYSGTVGTPRIGG